MVQRSVTASFFLALMLLVASPASAHMAWLTIDNQGHAIVWFGESPSDRTYHMPDAVASIKLFGDSGQPIKMARVDSDDLVGLRSVKTVAPETPIRGSVAYGLYHGTKLTYHVAHHPSSVLSAIDEDRQSEHALRADIKPTNDGGVEVTVLHHGKPKADVAVTLYAGNEDAATDDETVKHQSDLQGRVRFAASSLGKGLNALLVGVTQKDAKGTFNGQDHSGTADYLTVTFTNPSDKAKPGAADTSSKQPMIESDSNAKIRTTGLPPLPEELTSFGAAIAGNTLYAYGGHTGSAHSYSKKEQSDRFWGLRLDAEQPEWTALQSGPRLQGLALVPWKEQVVRIGGFTAMNEEGQDQDLRSQTAVAMYDPAHDRWTDLPALPEPRSSFDAAVLNDTVYVFGGWQLEGGSDTTWHQTAWSLDLANGDAKWQQLAEPPFQRRALSVAAHDGKLYVIGGMRSEDGPTTRVDIYDPQKGTWSRGPQLPGSGMSGFGTAAYAADDMLYVNTMDGFVHRLDSNQEAWTTIAKVEPSRFFHRMLPHDGRLLLIGGANMEVGKFTTIEAVILTAESE